MNKPLEYELKKFNSLILKFPTVYNNKYDLIKVFQEYLSKVVNSTNKNTRLNFCRELFCILYNNKLFIEKHSKFNNVVKSKLQSFYNFDKLHNFSNLYYYKIYNKTIDGSTINTRALEKKIKDVNILSRDERFEKMMEEFSL